MTEKTEHTPEAPGADDVVARVLARAETRAAGYSLFTTSSAQALQRDTAVRSSGFDGDQTEREDRQALRRVAGLSTELEDDTEVE